MILRETINGDSMTPISMFQRLKGERKWLLESSLKHEASGRYSFIGCNPFCEITGRDDQVVTRFFDGTPDVNETGKPLDVIDRFLKEYGVEGLPDLPFPGGGIGYISYDAFRQYEKIGLTPHDEHNMPDVHLMFYRELIAYDHQTQKVTIVVLPFGLTEDEQQNVLAIIKEQIQSGEAIQYEHDPLEILTYESNETKESFCASVEQAKEHILSGDIFQIVLSQRLSATFTGSAFAFYRKLRQNNPSPYMFYIDFNDYVVLGASPESLIRITGDEVTTNPIAGTRKRGLTKEEDIRMAEDLLQDEKELAEHRMLVDLGRNDLGKVCTIGSVELTKFMVIERFQHVMHIVSEVKGKLSADIKPLDALISTLPAGTVSGAPKIRAMQLINELETVKRGVYSGAIGYIGYDGNLDFALAIRTMVIKDGRASVQAGAGVVYDSIPENEYEETMNKARSLLEVSR